ALVAALDAREHETSDHSQRVVEYTAAIADRLGIRGPELEEIGRGALLHDIGKIGVPDAVLLKPARLTTQEWADMKRHPELGSQMIQGTPVVGAPGGVVGGRRERLGGGGCPRGRGGGGVRVGAGIFARADAVGGRTSGRPYRTGTSFENAVHEIER